MQPDPQAYADILVVAIKTALAPILATQKALQDDIVALAARFEDDALSRDVAAVWRDVAAVRERLAVVETRPLLPGPPGEPGAPGKDGEPGKAGLRYEGVYQDGKAYDVGELVTWGGSAWHCNTATTTKPGESAAAWTLMVKRGRDGKDARP